MKIKELHEKINLMIDTIIDEECDAKYDATLILFKMVIDKVKKIDSYLLLDIDKCLEKILKEKCAAEEDYDEEEDEDNDEKEIDEVEHMKQKEKAKHEDKKNEDKKHFKSDEDKENDKRKKDIVTTFYSILY